MQQPKAHTKSGIGLGRSQSGLPGMGGTKIKKKSTKSKKARPSDDGDFLTRPRSKPALAEGGGGGALSKTAEDTGHVGNSSSPSSAAPKLQRPATSPHSPNKLMNVQPEPMASASDDEVEIELVDDEDELDISKRIIAPAEGDKFEMKTAVTVAVRCRPMSRMELRKSPTMAWKTTDAEVSLITPTHQMLSKGLASSWNFDHVFGPKRTNTYLFAKIGLPVVQQTMAGYNGCMFAYGQTSSGKTFTIKGCPDDPGMIPRSVAAIFQYIEQCPYMDFSLKVSYIECYNESLKDLLNPEGKELEIQTGKDGSQLMQNITLKSLSSPDQAMKLIAEGEEHRHVGSTDYNAVSSRSHTIFRIHVESTSKNIDNAKILRSVLNIVDLAGSENTVKVGAENVARIKETGFINKSLLTLGACIFKMTEKPPKDGKPLHVPFRDSKLTRVLQQSLNGSACISIMCAMSPAGMNTEETISTLKFASRAKKIRSNAKVNASLDPQAQIKLFQREIAELKKALAKAKKGKVISPTTETEGGDQAEANKPKDKEKVEEEIIEEDAQTAIVKFAEAGHILSSTSNMEPITIEDCEGFDGEAPVSKRKTTIRGRAKSLRVANTEKLIEAAMQASEQKGRDDQYTNLSVIDLDDDISLTNPSEEYSVESLLKKMAQMEMKIASQETEISTLKEQLQNAEATLQDWDQFAVSVENKQNAIGETLQYVADQRAQEQGSVERQTRRGSTSDELLTQMLEGIGLNSDLSSKDSASRTTSNYTIPTKQHQAKSAMKAKNAQHRTISASWAGVVDEDLFDLGL